MRKVVNKEVTAGGRLDFFLDSELVESSQHHIRSILYPEKSKFEYIRNFLKSQKSSTELSYFLEQLSTAFL